MTALRSQATPIVAWVWFIAAGCAGLVGMIGLYRNPALVHIPGFAQIYGAAGLSDVLMITLLLALPLATSFVAAGLIMWRKGHDSSAVLLAVCLLAVYFYVSGAAMGLPAMWARQLTSSIASVLVAAFLVMFPTGSFVPRWSVTTPLVAAALAIARPDLSVKAREIIRSPELVAANDQLFVAAVWAVLLISAVTWQTIRWRHHATATHRYQARWVLAGLLAMLMPASAILVLTATGLASSPVLGVMVSLSAIGSYILPVAIAVAIFRYHLYEIDRIISRTVTYGLLAVVVAAIYILSILLIPSVLGASNDLMVAGATLAAAAVFRPARRRIQLMVDGRFNRARFDAEREIDWLNTGLRQNIDLRAIQDRLSATVSRTVQPAITSIWIKDRN